MCSCICESVCGCVCSLSLSECACELCCTDTSLGPRIGHVSDTDTHPIHHRYVSPEYPIFSYFCEYWIRELIRICLADTPSPTRRPVPYPLSPTPALARPCLVPHPRSALGDAASLLAGRWPPATSLRLCPHSMDKGGAGSPALRHG